MVQKQIFILIEVLIQDILNDDMSILWLTILPLVIFAISLILTFIIKVYATRYHILDIPNNRSSHNMPTPRGGGLAIVLAWFIGITVLFFSDHIGKNLFLAFMSGILIAFVSIIDDILNLNPIIRLCCQVVASTLGIFFLGGIVPINFFGIYIESKIILYGLPILAVVWFINLFNFLDGIDGYASIEAIFIGASIFLFTYDSLLPVLIASSLGFLFWNWPKAKIFMGDVGSTQLGFIIAIASIYYHNSHEFSIIHSLMLSSLFWFDATLTIYRRWRVRENLTVAHKKHAYQRAVQSGLSHKKTIVIASLINLFILLMVYLSVNYEYLSIPLFLIEILILYAITRIIDRKVAF